MSEDPRPPDDQPTPPSPAPKSGGGWMSNLLVRLATAAVGIPILLWMLFLGPTWVFPGLVIAAAAVAGSEMATMTLRGHPRLQGSMVVFTVALAASMSLTWDAGIQLATLYALIGFAVLPVMAWPEPLETAAYRMAWGIAGPVYLGSCLASVTNLFALENGGTWVVLSMALAWGSDTGAYFAGRFFGRRKLHPKVSPSKTVEGAVGGLVSIVLLALAMHFLWLPELGVLHAVALALVAGSLGQAGDLVVSAIKRSTGVKDSGFIVPGHGGLLDRIDALMFTAVATWLYARWVLAISLRPIFPWSTWA